MENKTPPRLIHLDLSKQYWVFEMMLYEEQGGLEDINMTTDDISEALEKFQEIEESKYRYSYVYDNKVHKICLPEIEESKEDPF